jgi:hypothetical protein
MIFGLSRDFIHFLMHKKAPIHFTACLVFHAVLSENENTIRPRENVGERMKNLSDIYSNLFLRDTFSIF